MDTLLFASLMGLYYWFARLRLGYTFSAMLLQPVVVAVFVGLLLGNMPAAMIIGAGMQLVYLGVTSTPGGNVPSDPALAACIAIPIAVKANMDPNLAIALAIPFGVIGGFFAVLYLKVDIMAMAIFGTCVAFLIKGLAKNEGAA
ncbi:PTS sugar transporter subunit IIC [Escherichia coli]|nr:PTS sugar transporter subunit IIC [Escherichia coli]EEZ6043297.1 PTS sugar transporter subunit IIC [Escherichia coli]EIG3113577.1 PTS sugar transporter subunit IIC [Escherichia coli]EIV1026342.1 PTS sugar transporter subunit IIC [Escherichia coli]